MWHRGAGIEQRANALVYSLKRVLMLVVGFCVLVFYFAGLAVASELSVAGITTRGTDEYPDGGMRRLPYTIREASVQDHMHLLIDDTNQYAYGIIGGFTYAYQPASIVKYRIGLDGVLEEKVAVSELLADENTVSGAVLDEARGYMYLAINDDRGYYDTYYEDPTPFYGQGRVVKVRLGEGDEAPERVSGVDLVRNREGFTGPLLMDISSDRLILIGTNYGSIISFQLEDGDGPPIRIPQAGGLFAGALEGRFKAHLDQESGYLFVINEWGYSGVSVHAWREETQRYVPVTSHPHTINGPVSGIYYDGATQRLFVGYRHGQMEIYLFDPMKGELVLQDTFQLSLGGTEGAFFNFDHERRVYYTETIVTIASGEKEQRFARYSMDQAPDAAPLEIFTTPYGNTAIWSSTFNPRTGTVYVNFARSPRAEAGPMLVSLDLTGETSSPVLAEFPLEEGYGHLRSFQFVEGLSSVFVSTSGANRHFLHFESAFEGLKPGFDLSTPIDGSDSYIQSGRIHPNENSAYYVMTGGAGGFSKLAKVNLTPFPEVVAETILEPRFASFSVAHINAVSKIIFLIARIDNTPYLYKVDISHPEGAPVVLNSMPVGVRFENVTSVEVDSGLQLGFMGTTGSLRSASVRPFYTGISSTSPIILEDVRLESRENVLRALYLDEDLNRLYVSTGTSGATWLAEYRYDSSTFEMERTGFLAVGTGTAASSVSTRDLSTNQMIVAADGSPPRITRINMNATASEETRSFGSLRLPTLDRLPGGIVADWENGLAHVAKRWEDTRIFSVALSHKHHILGMKIALSEEASVNGLRFFSHRGEGNIRFAIYDDGEDPQLLWESDEIVNSAEEAWMDVPLDGGSPDTLNLEAGHYWLAWQSDSNAAVASYHESEEGSGFRLRRLWGAYPESILFDDELELNSERWAMHLVYNSGSDWMDFPVVPEGEVMEGEVEAEYELPAFQDLDINRDYKISLSEVLRLIQFFNVKEFHCAEESEDGYAAGPGDRSCRPHTSDTDRNWSISLGELLRGIQFFNAGSYHVCTEHASLDGYCI